MIVLLFVFPSPKRSIRAVILNNSMNFFAFFLKAVANIHCFLVLTTPTLKKNKLFLFDVVHSFFADCKYTTLLILQTHICCLFFDFYCGGGNVPSAKARSRIPSIKASSSSSVGLYVVLRLMSKSFAVV